MGNQERESNGSMRDIVKFLTMKRKAWNDHIISTSLHNDGSGKYQYCWLNPKKFVVQDSFLFLYVLVQIIYSQLYIKIMQQLLYTVLDFVNDKNNAINYQPLTQVYLQLSVLLCFGDQVSIQIITNLSFLIAYFSRSINVHCC